MNGDQKRERAGSFPVLTKGLSPGLRINKIPKEPDVKCPVCRNGLERFKAGDGTSRAACPSCGFTWSRRG